MKQRVCQIVVNQGPDGTNGVFSMSSLTATGHQKFVPQAEGLVPLSDYQLNIAGWTHWTEIRCNREELHSAHA